MATITISDLNESKPVNHQESADVKGGAWYAKFDGVDGSCSQRLYVGGLNFVLGDGSVRDL